MNSLYLTSFLSFFVWGGDDHRECFHGQECVPSNVSLVSLVSETLFGFTGGYQSKSMYHNGQYLSHVPKQGGPHQRGPYQGKDIYGNKHKPSEGYAKVNLYFYFSLLSTGFSALNPKYFA